MHPEVDGLSLPELVDRLEDLETKRTPVGWSPDDAVERAAVERRIMAIVGGKPPAVERRRVLRIPCRLTVKLRSKHKTVRAAVSNVGAGGVFVKTDAEFQVGTPVELEVRGSSTEEHGLRVRGEVVWADREAERGVGVSFVSPTSAHERRMRRFVLELLRHRAAV